MDRRSPAGRVLHRAAALIALAAGLVACSDGPTSPRDDRSAVQLAFVDNLFRLTLLRAGGTPVATGVMGIVPFAASAGRVAYWRNDTLHVYDVASGQATASRAVGQPANMAATGALSPDGERIAFVSGSSGAPLFVHLVNLETGARDSSDYSGGALPADPLRLLDASPVFSHDGQRIGFLLPTMLAMHFFTVEPFNWRAEQHLLWVPTATIVEAMPGAPRWLQDGTVRFVARKRTVDAVPVDTIMLLSTHPNRGELGAIIEYEAPMPDTLTLDAPRGYSFTADGRTAALTITANGRDGIFLLREGAASLEPLVFGASQAPRYPLIVP